MKRQGIPRTLFIFAIFVAIFASASSLTGCTGQIPGAFRLGQEDETFDSSLEINTKIDLLWVVDNSASMDVSQKKLRDGFATFAEKYLQPTWDIRVAVITTDTYLADPIFNDYLNRTIASTTGWASPHISARGIFTNPETNPSLIHSQTLAFTSGVKYGDLVPAWGPDYARLLPGLHDGPIAALCFELLPYFFNGVSQCAIRDAIHANTGTANCLNPATGESSTSQCVNTVQNNTVRSGNAILQTRPDPYSPPKKGSTEYDAWKAELAEDLANQFMINVSTGSAGHGSERGLGSVLQLLSDNESTETAFFRKNSLRGIIFVSDEDDQTMELPDTASATFHPQSDYRCDMGSLTSLNPTANIQGVNGLCCNDPAKNCRYGSLGISCESKTVDDLTYTVGICPDPEKLIPVSEVKNSLDTFFTTLDQTDLSAGADPNYFIGSIVALTGAAITELQNARLTEDASVGATKVFAVDRGDRYLELGELVGGGSLSLNIAESDYTEILDSIGRAIIEKKSQFPLSRAPTGEEDMVVSITHSDDSVTILESSQFEIVEKTLVVTDEELILSLEADDQMNINYQPKTLY